MKRMRWIAAMLLILVMMALGGCAGRGGVGDGTVNDGTLNNGRMSDGSMNNGSMNNGTAGNGYDSNYNNGGIMDDTVDGVNGGMNNGNTIPNDTQTNLGNLSEQPQLNR